MGLFLSPAGSTSHMNGLRVERANRLASLRFTGVAASGELRPCPILYLTFNSGQVCIATEQPLTGIAGSAASTHALEVLWRGVTLSLVASPTGLGLPSMALAGLSMSSSPNKMSAESVVLGWTL